MTSLGFSPISCGQPQILSSRSSLLSISFSARTSPCCSIYCRSSSYHSAPGPTLSLPGPVLRKRKRYRKSYPGEDKGITEEMRFVAMRLQNEGKRQQKPEEGEGGQEGEKRGSEETWRPSMEGLFKYLVDSKVVFDTLERIVDQSDDVAYVHFRKTGLERTEGLTRDIEWLSQLGIAIPQPSAPGTTYAAYLKEIATKCVPSFLSHFYNIYFGHATGGKAIGRQVSEKLLDGKELEFYKWEIDEFELLKDVRENLNNVGEHWSRDEKNRCLRETTKCFRYAGQIIRLIIL